MVLRGVPLFSKCHGQRVTKAMWSFERDAELAVPDEGLKSLRDAVGFSTPMGARFRRKILRYGAGGVLRFKCFVKAVATSLVSGSASGKPSFAG